MHLSCFDIGKLIPSVSVQVVLVGGIRCMVLSTCDLGVHVCLTPPDCFTLGCVLLSLGFMPKVRWHWFTYTVS